MTAIFVLTMALLAGQGAAGENVLGHDQVTRNVQLKGPTFMEAGARWNPGARQYEYLRLGLWVPEDLRFAHLREALDEVRTNLVAISRLRPEINKLVNADDIEGMQRYNDLLKVSNSHREDILKIIKNAGLQPGSFGDTFAALDNPHYAAMQNAERLLASSANVLPDALDEQIKKIDNLRFGRHALLNVNEAWSRVRNMSTKALKRLKRAGVVSGAVAGGAALILGATGSDAEASTAVGSGSGRPANTMPFYDDSQFGGGTGAAR